MAASQRYLFHALLAGCQLESVLTGGNSDGSIQLRLDNSGARLSAGGQLAVAMVECLQFSMAMDTNL